MDAESRLSTLRGPTAPAAARPHRRPLQPGIAAPPAGSGSGPAAAALAAVRGDPGRSGRLRAHPAAPPPAPALTYCPWAPRSAENRRAGGRRRAAAPPPLGRRPPPGPGFARARPLRRRPATSAGALLPEPYLKWSRFTASWGPTAGLKGHRQASGSKAASQLASGGPGLGVPGSKRLSGWSFPFGAEAQSDETSVFHKPPGRGKSWITGCPAPAAFPDPAGQLIPAQRAGKQHASWCPVPERFPSAMTKGSCAQPPGKGQSQPRRGRGGRVGWVRRSSPASASSLPVL